LVVAERTGGGRRILAWVVVLGLAILPVWASYRGVQLIWFSVSGPVVRVKVVECHSVTKGSACTGVWRPTGEPERTVTMHGDARGHDTVNARIGGDEAFLDDDRDETIVFGLGFLGCGVAGLALLVVVIVRANRKSDP
jgi:hypothetical protein